MVGLECAVVGRWESIQVVVSFTLNHDSRFPLLATIVCMGDVYRGRAGIAPNPRDAWTMLFCLVINDIQMHCIQ